MARFVWLFLGFILVNSVVSETNARGQSTPAAATPNAEFGRITLQQPISKDVQVYANWLHDRRHGYRILIPAESTVQCPPSPQAEKAYTFILSVQLHDMPIVDFALVPEEFDGQKLTEEIILADIPADERTEVSTSTSMAKTTWTFGSTRQTGDNAPPPVMTWVTRHPTGGFLVMSFAAGTPFETQKAICIAETLEFVPANFQLDKVLTEQAFEAPADKFSPVRTGRAWFENGTPNGLVVQHDDQGRRVYTETIYKGKDHGLSVKHWPNGSVFEVRFFERGTQQGMRLTYYQTGEMLSLMQFENGVQNGMHATFYRTGQNSVVSTNVNGKPHGQRLHHLPDGTVYGRTMFDNGRQVGNEVYRELTQSEYDIVQSSDADPAQVWKK